MDAAIELSVRNYEETKGINTELNKQTLILMDIRSMLKSQTKKKGAKGADGQGPSKVGNFSGLKKLDKGTIGIAALAMLSIGAAIVAVAGMFSLIPAVSGMQILTALAISVAFIPMAIAFTKIAKILSRMGGKMGAKTPAGLSLNKPNNSGIWSLMGATLLSMIGMGAAVVATSYLFQLIMPVSPIKAATAIFISLAMVGMGYAYAKIARSLSRVKGKKKALKGNRFGIGEALSMAGVGFIGLVGMAAAVAVSSWIFQLVMPVNPIQLLTAFGISIVMIPIAYAFGQIVKSVSKLKGKKKKFKGGSVFEVIGAAALSIVGIAAALTLSSWVMTLIAPVEPIKLLTALAIGIIMIPAGFAFSLIAKGIKRVKIKDLLMTTVAIPLIAIGLTAAAWVFTFLPGEFKAPPYEWTAKAGAALVVFGVGYVILAKTVGKMGIKSMIFGVIGVAAVAVAVLATAWIFSILPGSFYAPDIGWSLSAMLAIVLFAVPVGIIGAILAASGGTGFLALIFGVIGIIIIAAGILAVSWIFSYIPADKLAKVASGLTDALLAPVNGMVDILKRLKEEIGVENLIPLAVGIIAISVSLLALAGATAGVAVGGLFSAIAGVGEAVFGAISEFFGGKRKKGPLEILETLIGWGPRIGTLSKNLDILATSFAKIVGYTQEDTIKKINDLIRSVILNPMDFMGTGFAGAQHYFDSYTKFLDDVADGFNAINTAQRGMDVQILDKTTELVKALAYLNNVGGDNAMAKLGDALVNAVRELSEMISKFGASVDGQTEAGQQTAGALEGVASKLKGFLGIGGKGSGGSSGGSSAGNFNSDDIVEAIEDLQKIIKKQNGGGGGWFS